MRARLYQLLEALRTGFWFVPSLMMLLAALLAVLLLHIDQRVDPGLDSSISWAYSGGPQGARSLLSTIAGSMITAASVTFSLASVALSIASQQYGSRVLRNFMRDRVTQVLLGTFVSTFLYSVLVVRSIRGSDYSGFVPAIAITVAIAMSLISLLMLVYFVHHVSSSIQASHIVSTISDDMQEAIPRLYPSEVANPAEQETFAPLPEAPALSLTIDRSGYLQSLETDQLLKDACHHDLYVEVCLKPGDHVLPGTVLATVRPDTLDSETRAQLRARFVVGSVRTATQDIRYQFQQLTDVIVRALSPGINDPFTAINGIDELTAGLLLLARRPRVAELRQDSKGTARLFVPHPGLPEVMRSTVGHIAVYAASDPVVMQRLFFALDAIAPDLQGQDEYSTLASLRAELAQRQRDSEAKAS